MCRIPEQRRQDASRSARDAATLNAETGPIGNSELPLLHRAAIAYLALPLAIWLLGWLRPWVGIPATALLAAGLWQALSGPWRPGVVTRTNIVLVLATLVWVMLSPSGGLFIHEWDWDTHRATFLDLTRGGWPTFLVDHFGEPKLLRYYLGWYMVPATVARAVGTASLDWTVPIWTWCGTALAAMLIARGLRKAWAALAAVAIVFLFSGVDAADVLLSRAVDWLVGTTPPAMLPEYRSLPRGFYIAPQHFLSAALSALLLIQLRNHQRFLAVSGVILAACLFWSAFVLVGLLPLAIALAVGKNRLRRLLGWRNFLVAAPLAMLATLYLTAGAVAFPRGWTWELWENPLHMAARFGVLYATEFLVVAVLVWRTNPAIVRDPFFVATVAALLIAPLRYYGTAVFDEWARKVSIPAVIAMAYYAAQTVALRLSRATGASESQAARQKSRAMRSASRAGRRKSQKDRSTSWKSRSALCMLVAMLLAGSAHAWTERQRLHFAPVAYRSSGQSLITDMSWYSAFQRLAERVSPIMRAILRENQDKPGWQGDLVIRSRYDVHVEQGNRIIYVRPNCVYEEEWGSWFFLEVEYGAEQDRPLHARRPPWDRWTVRRTGENSELLVQRMYRRIHYAKGRGCTLVAWLPSEVASFRTGQIGFGGRLAWEAEAQARE